MKKPILNLADAPRHSGRSGDRFEYTMSMLAGTLGARAIGANVTRVPPGKAAFPLHHHRANEEHFFIVSGRGVLRVGPETFEVKPHDYVVNPPGGPDEAHQLINTGSEDLVYLAISTLVVPDVIGYPDSGKTGVRISGGQEPGARFLVQDAARDAVGYWDDEDGRVVADIVARHR